MFEVKQSGDKYHFVLKAGNGQVILSSQMYASKSGAMNGIESVRKNSQSDARFERKSTRAGKWRFNLRATNGQVIGVSESYESEKARENGIASVAKNAPGAKVVDETA